MEFDDEEKADYNEELISALGLNVFQDKKSMITMTTTIMMT
jgi:hypothetical protein